MTQKTDDAQFTLPESARAKKENWKLKQTAYSTRERLGGELCQGWGGKGSEKASVRFEIHEWLEPRELGSIREYAHDAADEGVAGHAHVPGGYALQELWDQLRGQQPLAVYQQRGWYVELFPMQIIIINIIIRFWNVKIIK
jgi:hypothetical protein